MARLEDTMFLRLRQRMLDQQASDRALTGQTNLSTARDLSNRDERKRTEENQFAQQRGATDQMNDEPLTDFEDPRMAQRAELGSDMSAAQALKDQLKFDQNKELVGARFDPRFDLARQQDEARMERDRLKYGWSTDEKAKAEAGRWNRMEYTERGKNSRAKRMADAIGASKSQDDILKFFGAEISLLKVRQDAGGEMAGLMGDPRTQKAADLYRQAIAYRRRGEDVPPDVQQALNDAYANLSDEGGEGQ